MTLNDELVRVLRSLDAAELQNKLLRLPDRDVAICLMHMNEGDELFVLSKLSVSKARRVKDDLLYYKKIRISEDQYKKTVENVLALVSGRGKVKTLRGYIRPRKTPRYRGY